IAYGRRLQDHGVPPWLERDGLLRLDAFADGDFPETFRIEPLEGVIIFPGPAGPRPIRRAHRDCEINLGRFIIREQAVTRCQRGKTRARVKVAGSSNILRDRFFEDWLAQRGQFCWSNARGAGIKGIAFQISLLLEWWDELRIFRRKTSDLFRFAD